MSTVKLTKFHALVSRESHAEIFFTRTGEAVHVVKIHERDNGAWLVEIAHSDGDTYTYPPCVFEPSPHLLALIAGGVYREDTMTHVGFRGMVTKLSY